MSESSPGSGSVAGVKPPPQPAAVTPTRAKEVEAPREAPPEPPPAKADSASISPQAQALLAASESPL